MVSEAAILAALARIEARLDRLEHGIVAGRPRLSRADLDVLRRLLPAIAAAIGSEPFLASELEEHAGPRIASAGLSARQIGRLLKRATGIAVDGFQVERLAVEAGAVVWRVVATS